MKTVYLFPLLCACSLASATTAAAAQPPRSAVPPAPEVEQGYAEVSNGRLCYEAAGAGEPVVLIHGNTADRRIWDDQVAFLAQSFRVIRYDVRGFGKSSLPVEGQPYSHHQDLATLLGHLRIPSAHILGLSMGTGIAVDFVIGHPSMSRSLVAAGPWVTGYDSPAAQEIWDAFAQVGAALNEGGREAALMALLTAPCCAESFRDSVDSPRIRAIGLDYSFWHFSHTDPQTVLTPQAIGRLSEISIPTLIVVGERDLPVCKEVGELLQKTVPGAKTAQIPRAGHMMNMENPEEFNRAVSTFLGGVAARGETRR